MKEVGEKNRQFRYDLNQIPYDYIVKVRNRFKGRRPSRVPGTAQRPNQSNLKGINPECSFAGLMLKLKLQYFGHLMQRADS